MKKLTLYEFIGKANKIHNSLYDYSKSVYITTQTKIEIICRLHGSFLQAPNDHLKGRGCPSCSGNKKLSLQLFVNMANSIHHNKYDYSKTVYRNNDCKIIIICKEHGDFLQIACTHLLGSGCPECGVISSYNKRVKNRNIFIAEANIVHHNFYDYTLANYIGALSDITIICPKHGKFVQRASAHLLGQRCPKCSNNYISRAEIKWLDSLSIPQQYRQQAINIDDKKYKVDAFDPSTNTIYEFYGDFWHGNPKVYKLTDSNWRNKKLFGDLYNETVSREFRYKNAGYNVVSMWESDFKMITTNNQ